MEQLLNRLHARFPALSYTEGQAFYWSPASRKIFYKASSGGKHAMWSLLHETGHGILGHYSYRLDFELLKLEAAAWQRAAEIAAEFEIDIDSDHIQDCLDTYRDWLYARSTCPCCSNKGIQQQDTRHYRCFNCRSTWKVAPSRFCRAYRMVESADMTTPVIF